MLTPSLALPHLRAERPGPGLTRGMVTSASSALTGDQHLPGRGVLGEQRRSRHRPCGLRAWRREQHLSMPQARVTTPGLQGLRGAHEIVVESPLRAAGPCYGQGPSAPPRAASWASSHFKAGYLLSPHTPSKNLPWRQRPFKICRKTHQ